MIKIVSICIFLFGYVIISQEHLIKINKTAVSLVLGIVLWFFVLLVHPGSLDKILLDLGGEIFSLVIFLLSAMTLVEIITTYGLFDFIYLKILKVKLTDRKLFFVISLLAFLFSTFINNLTTTIVFLYIAKRFFKGENLIKASASVVIASNIGGVFSPIGDVTTTMLWLAGKYSASNIFLQAVIPSVIVFLVSTLIMGRSLEKNNKDRELLKVEIKPVEWVIISLCLLSFFLPLLMTGFHLPPYMGLLLGLGIVWLTVDIVKPRVRHSTALDTSIETFFQKTDIASLNFFIGILLAIGALRHLGILDDISHSIFTTSPSESRIIMGNILMGGLSAIFDNIPLTAAAVDIVKTTNQSLWVLLAFSVGIGGSILLIGSGSGIIAMTIVKELTFMKYLKIATIPVLIAFSLGILVWYLQFILFH